MGDNPKREHKEIGVFQLLVLALSLVVLGALAANTAFQLPPEISRVLKVIDGVICVIFLIDFMVRFRQARSKLEFLKWGWIDLVASIPYVPILRVGRLVRIFRIIQLLRAVRATHKITRVLLKAVSNRRRLRAVDLGFAAVLFLRGHPHLRTAQSGQQHQDRRRRHLVEREYHYHRGVPRQISPYLGRPVIGHGADDFGRGLVWGVDRAGGLVLRGFQGKGN